MLDSTREHQVTATVDLTLIGHYYERFADNAVEVGRHTIFLSGETADRWTPRAGDSVCSVGTGMCSLPIRARSRR